MAVLFFQLRNVPADEADDIRQLLTDNDIAYYETSVGNWGIFMPALWLYQTEDLAKARQLFDTYQQLRASEQRAQYLQRKSEGQHQSFIRHNLRKPLQFCTYSLLISLILYISIKWLFELGL